MLKAKLYKLNKLCGARETIIREITTCQAREFLNRNHRQGYCNCNKKLGAFYNEDLVAVMTFSKPSISKGRKDQKSNNYELSRFATVLDYNIPGMVTKFLVYFKNNYLFDSLFTFADRRFSTKMSYSKLGFVWCGNSPPCYWYFNVKESIGLTHRFNFRKSVLKNKLKTFDPTLTEYQNMLSNGYDRVWDCGHFKFVYGE